MLAYAAVFISLLSLMPAAVSGQMTTPRDLQERENQYTRGVLHGNVKLLDDVWADTFVDTDEEGGFSTKAQQLEKVAKSKAKIVSLKVDQERTDLYGDTAVVTERFRVMYVLGAIRGEEVGRSTDVWVKQKGRWMCVAAHSSALPAA